MTWYFYIGLIAAICIAIFSLPQLIKCLKTKDTSGISIVMFLLLSFGNLFFVINAIGILVDVKNNPDSATRLSAGLPLLLANAFAVLTSIIILFYKYRNMRWAKELNITEKTFCSNWKENKRKVYEQRLQKEKDKLKSGDNK